METNNQKNDQNIIPNDADKQQKGVNVPNLRFSTYSDNYESTTLENITSYFKSGKTFSKKLSDYGVFPVFGGNGIRGYSDEYNFDGNYILIGRQGALCGNIKRYNGKFYATEHAVVVKSTEDTDYLFYLLQHMDLGQYSGQSAQPGLAVNKLIKLICKIPSSEEQYKIGKFLRLIDNRINTQSKIIEDLECQINYIRCKLFKGYIKDDINNQKYIFNKIFISYKKLNEQSLQQYTIGKNGIKSMSNHLNYSINSHIVFMPNTLILGIGIDEIGVSIDTTGCCSPIYKTYTINNEIVDTLFLNIFANDYFSMIKNRVTQKSTRREFEFDYKELAKTLFTLPDIEIQKKDAQIVNKFYFKLQKEKDILELYKKQKAYLLKNMFI